MRMGNIASPWRYNAGGLLPAPIGKSATGCDFGLSPSSVIRSGLRYSIHRFGPTVSISFNVADLTQPSLGRRFPFWD